MRLGRLRWGEILAGAGGLALAASLFLVDWYGRTVDVRLPGATADQAVGRATERLSGWEALTILRWLLLAAALASLALVVVQVTQRSAALPANASVAATWLGLLGSALVLYRIVNQPGPDDEVTVEPGAWLGLLTALMVAVGAWWSMRDEGPGLGGDEERPPIPTLRVDALPDAEPAPGEAGGPAGSVPPPGR